VLQQTLGIGAQQPLWKRRRLRQQEPRPGAQRRSGAHSLKLVNRGYDVEQCRAGHPLGMIQLQAKRDPGTSVMNDDRKTLVAKRRHQLYELSGHLPL
jgi:hypothetical protein